MKFVMLHWCLSMSALQNCHVVQNNSIVRRVAGKVDTTPLRHLITTPWMRMEANIHDYRPRFLVGVKWLALRRGRFSSVERVRGTEWM